jgi:hypothetical protein
MEKYILLILVILRSLIVEAQTVGIGTTGAHRAKLEVHGAVGSTSAIFGAESTGVSVQRSWPSIGFNQYYDGNSKFIGNGYAAVQYLDPSTGTLSFDFFRSGVTNGICPAPLRMLTLSNSGNISLGNAIGNTSSLSVNKIIGTEATINLYGTTHLSSFNYGPDENTYIRGGKNNSMVFINDITAGRTVFSGYVGINTSTPQAALEIRQSLTNPGGHRGFALVEPQGFNNWEVSGVTVAGVSYLSLYYNDTYNSHGYFTSTDGSYFYFSDRRLKTDIKPLQSVIERVLQLEAVEYELKKGNPEHTKSVGFIAQDLKKFFPQLVSVATSKDEFTNDIPDLHTVNYDGIGVIAIKAVQEQQSTIESHGSSIRFLKERIDLLEKRLNTRIKKQ